MLWHRHSKAKMRLIVSRKKIDSGRRLMIASLRRIEIYERGQLSLKVTS